MADNILEAVLSKDIDKRFEAIDKRLESIEKHTENTVKALGGLGATLVSEFGTMSKGLDDLTGGINRLTVALSKMGSVGTSSAKLPFIFAKHQAKSKLALTGMRRWVEFSY